MSEEASGEEEDCDSDDGNKGFGALGSGTGGVVDGGVLGKRFSGARSDLAADGYGGKSPNPKSIVEGLGACATETGIGVLGGQQGGKEPEWLDSLQDCSIPRVSRVSRDIEGFFDNPGLGCDAVRGYTSGCSLFVGNIPFALSRWRLKMIFSRFGTVSDVFIPHKSSKSNNSRFAFVRFRRKEDVFRAIEGMDGELVEGHKLEVNVAKYPRSGQSKLGVHQCEFAGGITSQKWRPISRGCAQRLEQEDGKENQGPVLPNPVFSKPKVGKFSYAQVVQECAGSSGFERPSGRGRVCVSAANSDWLLASFVGTLRVGCEFVKVRSNLLSLSDKVKGVSFLGGCTCLMSFESVRFRDEALNDPVWNSWFYSMEPWKGDSTRGSPRVWINCVGVPLTAWNMESFDQIAKQWGKLIDIDVDTKNQSQFVIASLLIESDLGVIDECFDLVVDGVFFNVQVSSSIQAGAWDTLIGKNKGSFFSKSFSGVVSRGGIHAEVCSQHYSPGNESPTALLEAVSSEDQPDGSEASVLEVSSDGGQSENQKSSEVELEFILYGFDEDNDLKILDTDAGCLINVGGGEEDGRYVLNELEMCGGNSSNVTDVIVESLLVKRSLSLFWVMETLLIWGRLVKRVH